MLLGLLIWIIDKLIGNLIFVFVLMWSNLVDIFCNWVFIGIVFLLLGVGEFIIGVVIGVLIVLVVVGGFFFWIGIGVLGLLDFFKLIFLESKGFGVINGFGRFSWGMFIGIFVFGLGMVDIVVGIGIGFVWDKIWFFFVLVLFFRFILYWL